ncbi:ATP synthase F0 sector subunit b [invertebrate metagenome]|uniref:ATP synthase F0 sector subunit b n=1 Tax=invertebrate metagenome TaxID=1711999 RepID=A0A484H8T2_9ZZZZ
MPVEFYATPDFWVAIAFLIVVGIGFKRVARGVMEVLDARAERIKEKINSARLLREEAQQLFAEYQRRQRDMVKEAEDIISYARAEAERQKAEALAELERVTQRRAAQALSRIAQAETQALGEVRNLAIAISIAATGRLVAENLDREHAKALVDQAIQELCVRQ